MRNFILILLILAGIPVIYFMGIQGLSFTEMLQKLRLRRE